MARRYRRALGAALSGPRRPGRATRPSSAASISASVGFRDVAQDPGDRSIRVQHVLDHGSRRRRCRLTMIGPALRRSASTERLDADAWRIAVGGLRIVPAEGVLCGLPYMSLGRRDLGVAVGLGLDLGDGIGGDGGRPARARRAGRGRRRSWRRSPAGGAPDRAAGPRARRRGRRRAPSPARPPGVVRPRHRAARPCRAGAGTRSETPACRAIRWTAAKRHGHCGWRTGRIQMRRRVDHGLRPQAR